MRSPSASRRHRRRLRRRPADPRPAARHRDLMSWVQRLLSGGEVRDPKRQIPFSRRTSMRVKQGSNTGFVEASFGADSGGRADRGRRVAFVGLLAGCRLESGWGLGRPAIAAITTDARVARIPVAV